MEYWILYGRLRDLVAVASLIGMAAVGVEVVRRLRGADRRALLAGAGLVLVAIAARLAVPWGSHDLNLRNMAAWFDGGPVSPRYGLGVQGLVRPLQWMGWGEWPLRVTPDLVAVVGGASVGLVALWVRSQGAPRWVAIGSGALLAVHPVHLLFSHTDAQPVVEVFWLFGALLWVDRHARQPGWGPALAVGLLAGLAAHQRPEAIVAAPMVLAVAWLGRHRVPWSQPSTLAGVGFATVLTGAQLWLQASLVAGEPIHGLSLTGLLMPPALVEHGVRHMVWFDPAYTMPLVGVLAVLAPRSSALPRGLSALVLVLGVGLSLLVSGDALWTPIGGERIGFARHQLRALPWLALATMLGLASLLEAVRMRWPERLPTHAGPLAAALLVLLGASTAPVAWQPRTARAELAWVDGNRDAVPSDGPCVILAPQHDQDGGLHLPMSALFPGHTVVRSGDMPEGGCRLYYRASECSLVDSSVTRAAPCGALEAAWTMTPLRETRLAAGTWIFDEYVVPTVRIGWYRVESPRP